MCVCVCGCEGVCGYGYVCGCGCVYCVHVCSIIVCPLQEKVVAHKSISRNVFFLLLPPSLFPSSTSFLPLPPFSFPEIKKLSDDFYSSLPHNAPHRSTLINSKRTLAQKQDLCQVRGKGGGGIGEGWVMGGWVGRSLGWIGRIGGG